LQKSEEEEELGEEEEKGDEGLEEVEQEVGPPLLTPLSEDAGRGPLHVCIASLGRGERKGTRGRPQGPFLHSILQASVTLSSIKS
jgi:hypothetical protein